MEFELMSQGECIPKVRWSFKLDSIGDLGMYANSILVGYIDSEDGSIYCNMLNFDEANKLKEAGFVLNTEGDWTTIITRR